MPGAVTENRRGRSSGRSPRPAYGQPAAITRWSAISQVHSWEKSVPGVSSKLASTPVVVRAGAAPHSRGLLVSTRLTVHGQSIRVKCLLKPLSEIAFRNRS